MFHVLYCYRFTRQNVLRVYPKSIRVDSSNYNPLIGWMHGVQMVAFNMQVYTPHPFFVPALQLIVPMKKKYK